MISIKSNTITGKLYRIIIGSALLTIIIVTIPMVILFSARVTNDALSDKSSLMREIMNQIDFQVGSITTESRRIQQDDTLGLLLKQYYQGDQQKEYAINLRLNYLISSLGDRYRNVIIKTDQGDVFNSISRVADVDLQALAIDNYAQYGKFYLSKPFVYFDGLGNRQGGISYITSFMTNSGVKGRIIININLSFFESVFKSIGSEVDQYVWLGYDGLPIYPETAADPRFDLELINNSAKTGNPDFRLNLKNGNDYNIVIMSKVCKWKLVALLTPDKLIERYRWYFVYFVLSLVSIMVIIMLTSLPMMRRQTKPLRQLSRLMKEISKGNLNIVSDIRTNDEIEDLSRSFNYMVSELKFYIAKSIDVERDKERIRYSLLISQINPHFIYNTLNTITYLVRQKRYGEIISVNSALIHILRDSLRVDGVQIFDTIEQEMEVVNQYINIQRYRYGQVFTIVWNLEESVKQLTIPKSIIQPLVENALFHGLLPCDAEGFNGQVIIDITLKNDKIVIKVTDNGIGMDQNKLAQTRKWIENGTEIRGKHIGLKNIISRVNHLYGSLEGRDRLQIESAEKAGTSISIILDKVSKVDQDNVFRFE